ncbi:MAG: branched-chain amino acid ABC transporter permease, partial [Bradyrhizobium sp.]|nr:branched-chain amino acid ABC transporter permease [Bradyrhizobium sp.]
MTARRSRLFAAIALVAVAAALVLIPLTLNRYGLYILSRWAVLAIAAIGLNLTLGYAGQVSLAHLAFLVFRNEEWLTKGIYGLMMNRPAWFASPLSFYYLCLGSLGVVSLATWWLIRSPWGRAFMALRENPIRALSLGIDTRRYTLMAFAIGSTLGGVSGVLYAPLVEFVDPTPFTLALSLDILMMVIVGGAGFFFGPFLGALIAVLLPEWLRFTQGFYLILYALLVMV